MHGRPGEALVARIVSAPRRAQADERGAATDGPVTALMPQPDKDFPLEHVMNSNPTLQFEMPY